MNDRVLTLRELNRATLARQLLLGRRRLPLARSLERVAGLQAQWPPSPYIGLWSRLEGFEREALVRALARRRVVKATLMRGTLHIVSAEDYLQFAAALKQPRLEELGKRFPNADLRTAADRALARAHGTPRTREELVGLAEADEEVYEWTVWHAIKARGDLLHVPPSGHWRHFREGPYLPASDWLGRTPADGDAGLLHLIRRYLAAFGPATRADVASWSGLPLARLEGAMAALEPELRICRDENGRLLLDLRKASRPSPASPAPARLLPKWDSVLLAHSPPERQRVLPERYRKTVIRANGDVLPTFLVDGFVAGLWQLERARRSAALVLEPFEPLPRGARRELEDEAARLVRFLEPEASAHAVRIVASRGPSSSVSGAPARVPAHASELPRNGSNSA